MFKTVDHIAILVRDSEEALTFYRDRLGLPVLTSERLEAAGVRLTHLDMGNVELQLVEPLSEDHPLSRELESRGESFHHLCWRVENTKEAMVKLKEYGLRPKVGEPHPGPAGNQAAFIEPADTRGILWEMTGKDAEKANRR